MMKKLLILLVLLAACTQNIERGGTMQNIEGVDIQWLGHSTFKIISDKIIYFDPFQLKTSFNDADIIFITHEHYDHCSLQDIERLIKPETVIVTIAECQSKISKISDKVSNIILMEPNQEKKVDGINVKTILSYNINKFRSPGLVFHPKEDGRVGFIINVNGKNVYHAGDTDFIPEIKKLSNIDIALVPVSGTYVMTAEEAAQAVDSFNPKVAVPMHYGSGVAGTEEDAVKFKSLVKGSQVIILKKS